jgi:hypothetical protein
MADPTDAHDPDEASDSASDEDFAPSAAASVASDDDIDSSADELAQGAAAGAPRKRKRAPQTKQDGEDLDSGDEATIRRGQERKERKRAKKEEGKASKPDKKKKKGKSKGKGGKKAPENADEEESDDFGLSDDDDEGEGGLIKTRAQRQAECVPPFPLDFFGDGRLISSVNRKGTRQRRPLYPIGQATADIDSIWSRLSSIGVGRREVTEQETGQTDGEATENAAKEQATGDDDMITITRNYTFAGEVKTETKRVPRDSAEGKLWLANHPENRDDKAADPEQQENAQEVPEKPLNRPMRRPSRFDGNPTGEIKALPPHLQSHWRTPLTMTKLAEVKKREQGAPANAAAVPVPPLNSTLAPGAQRKGKGKETRPGALNTVEKSRLDWVGFVDKSGIQNELEVHSKGKEGYLERMDFLDRMADRREAAAKGS